MGTNYPIAVEITMREFETYEHVASYLLNQFASEFGLEYVEGKQSVEGKATSWEIDAKGIKKGGVGFLVVECRRYPKHKDNQKGVAALAFTIIDTGATGGIHVSPLGFQSGARKIANLKNIIEVKLDEKSTKHEFVLEFLNKVMVGIKLSMEMGIDIACDMLKSCHKCGTQFPEDGSNKLCPKCTKLEN